MNPLAKELNELITAANPHVYDMLSNVGKNLFFPKGILSQSAEAKEKAHKFNATIGMATERGRTMCLSSIIDSLNGLEPEQALTYAPSFGIMPIRQAWQKALFDKNRLLNEKKISLPVVSNAITHGLSVVSDMWVDPGDKIILPDKMWGNYNLIFAVRREGHIVNYPFFNKQGGFNLEGFKDCVESEAKENGKLIVILNFPNNPTGYTITPEEGDKIAQILADLAKKGTNILAVIDDAYFGLFYDEGVLDESIFSKLVGADPRLLAIKLDGITKEDYAWGLRIGFITYGAYCEDSLEKGYVALEKKTAGAVRGSISNASHLSQEIALKAMQSQKYAREKKEKFQIMKARAMTVKSVLADPKYNEAWDVYPFNSGYFMCLKLKTVASEPLRKHLLDKYGVGLISLGKTDLRVAFSCLETKDVQELFDTVLSAVKDLE
jgi:aspartate/methionine/tyrosine aminotransferase